MVYSWYLHICKGTVVHYKVKVVGNLESRKLYVTLINLTYAYFILFTCTSDDLDCHNTMNNPTFTTIPCMLIL